MDEPHETSPLEEHAPTPRPSEPLPPHPAFATVVKLRHSRRPLWVVLAVILIVAGTYGSYYWQHRKVNTLRSQAAAASQTINTLKGQVSVLQKQTAPSATGVLKIPELGIQVTLPSKLSDMTYAVTDHSASTTSVGLSTLGLITLDPLCVASQAPLGLLTKTNGQYPITTATPGGNRELVKQYSSYYIAYESPLALTCSKIKTAQTLQTTDTAALPTWSTAIQPLQ